MPPLRLLRLAAVAMFFACFGVEADAQSLHETIRQAQQKVVKIYGAGGIKGLEAYQTGVLISPDGLVLTVESYVLDTDDLVVVLDDGRRLKCKLRGSDPVRELALLELQLEPGEAVPFFELASAPSAAIGERVLALSNLFNIAAGDEPVSVLQGVITAVAPLDARRGASNSSFHGDVYIVDAAANNPGAGGGALVDWQGHFLGVLGKELRSRATGAWLHYAIPADQFIASVETMKSGVPISEKQSGPAPADPLRPADLGIVLVPDVLPRTPPYIDAVVADSAADQLDLRPDDLIVFIEGEPTASCAAVNESLARRERFDSIRISVLRNGELVEVTLDPAAAADAGSADVETEE